MHGCAGSRRRAGQASLRHIRGNRTPARPAGAVRHRGNNRHGNNRRGHNRHGNNRHGSSHRRSNRHDGRHRVDRGPRTGANHPAAPP